MRSEPRRDSRGLQLLTGWSHDKDTPLFTSGPRAGPTRGADEPRTGGIKALEREVRELRQANEILRKASAYFAQAELDRRFKP